MKILDGARDKEGCQLLLVRPRYLDWRKVDEQQVIEAASAPTRARSVNT